jgi:ribosomal protein S18 acetylase RimI-like enzyme
VRVERHDDAGSFLDRAADFLLAREAEHNLMIGLAGRLRTDPCMYGEDPYMAALLEGDEVVAASLRTPPHNLILSEMPDDLDLQPLAEDVASVFGSLPGAVGPSAAVERFVGIWQARTGAGARIGIRQRSYQAEEALLPDGVPGELRPYRDGDRELVLDWMDAFVTEALPGGTPEDSAGWLDRRLDEPAGGVMLWEDGGEAVSLGSFGGQTPNGIRIGPVYTPPELRRRGYASALTAEITRMLLEGGRRFCFLFTDLANPTANSIYQRIGYRPVTDVDQWTFE